MPDIVAYKSLGFSFSYTKNSQEATYNFHVRGASIVSRLALNSKGAAGNRAATVVDVA